MRRFLSLACTLCVFVGSSAWAVPPAEVTDLVIGSDEQTLSWASTAGAAGYHLYRGDVAGLPNNGVCLSGSLITTSGTDASNPAPGQANFYFASAFNPDGEGSYGQDSNAIPRSVATPCDPARRIFDLVPNGDIGDGVIDGIIPRRNPSLQSWNSKNRLSAVVRHTGEFFYRAMDLRIPGRGLDWHQTRYYHSQISYDGPLGHNWDFPFNARLLPDGQDVIFFDGTGRREVFAFNGGGYDSPQGMYAVLHENNDSSWTLRHPDGLLQNFRAFAGAAGGSLDSLEDRAGNRLTFLYDTSSRLITVVDSMGRSISYGYDAADRIETVTDFSGREIRYSYDANGDLQTARSPIVLGTPNGNDFPNGKTEEYAYDPGHQLLSIVAPNEFAVSGPPRLTNVYGTTGFDSGRVTSQTIGGTNGSGIAAGGSITYAYTQIGASSLTLPDQPSRSVLITDRNGNETDHVHNALGNELTREERTNRNVRAGEPDYVTDTRYNVDGEMLQIDRPLLNSWIFTYDTPGADRYREGNLLERRFIADTVASGGRGDGRGVEIDDIVHTYTYDPLYNRRRTVTGPRENDPSYTWPVGNPVTTPGRETHSFSYDYEEGDPATNGVTSYATRFGVDMTGARSLLGDLNGDSTTSASIGSQIRIDRPVASLFPGSAQESIEGDVDQESVQVVRFNGLGQRIGITDAEGNVDEYVYFPETDPDGDSNPTGAPADGRTLDAGSGGYLATRIFDTTSDPVRNNQTNPAPTSIQHDWVYDSVGNRIGFVDGRGVLTTVIVNALNQPVETRRAAATATASGPFGDPATGRGEGGLGAFGYRERLEYDANDNVVRLELEDDVDSRGLGIFIPEVNEYDILDDVVREERSANTPLDLVRTIEYDANENVVRTVQPEGNAHTAEYDERDLLFTATRGSSGPRGGTPSTFTYDYDGNRNVTHTADGRGADTDYTYDGFDRLVTTVDRVGNRIEHFHDPLNLVRVELFGPIGGPTPPNRLGATNVALSGRDLIYDERDRLVRVDHELFVSPGVSPVRPPVLVEGPLQPGDSKVNTVYEYDRVARLTFTTQDSGSEARNDYDGYDRLVVTTQPDSSEVRIFYDGNSNRVERVDTEQPAPAGPPTEQFITTYSYDSLDRKTRTVDPAGQTNQYFYDSLDQIIEETNARGPAGGTINRVSSGAVVPINAPGNVSRFVYDGLDRLVERSQLLTPSGEGDGSTSPPLDTSNPANPDGLVTRIYVYDDNSLITSEQDDASNSTQYTYDNLNRLVGVAHADGTNVTRAYDENDNVVTVVDPNGSTVTNTYDALDRCVDTSIVRGAGVQGTTSLTYEYDGMSRVTRDTNDNDPVDGNDDAERRVFYDSLSRVIELQQDLAGLSSKQFSTEFAAHALPTQLIYPSGTQIGLQHDPTDRLQGMNDLGRPEGLDYRYFGMHRVQGMGFGNGVELNVIWDENRRQQVREYVAPGPTPIATWENVFDRANNLEAQRDLHNPLGPDARGEIFLHDSVNRLRDTQEAPLDGGFNPTGAPNDDTIFVLDGNSNFNEIQRNGVPYLFQGANDVNEYDEPNPPGDDGVADDVWDDGNTPGADGLNQQRDANGNLIDSGVFTFEFNALNQVVAVIRNSDGNPVSILSYYADGRLAKREALNISPQQDEQIAYYHRPAAFLSPVSDLVVGSTVVEQFDFADQRVLTVVPGQNGERAWQVDQGGNSVYVGHDARGNAALVTDGNTGNVLERINYAANGTPYFLDASNNFKVDGSGNFLFKSDFDIDALYGGGLYLDETGQRSNQRQIDFVPGIILPESNGYEVYLPSTQRDVTPNDKVVGIHWGNPSGANDAPVKSPPTPPSIVSGLRPSGEIVLEWNQWHAPSVGSNVEVFVASDKAAVPIFFDNAPPRKEPIIDITGICCPCPNFDQYWYVNFDPEPIEPYIPDCTDPYWYGYGYYGYGYGSGYGSCWDYKFEFKIELNPECPLIQDLCEMLDMPMANEEDPIQLPPQYDQLRMELGNEAFSQWLHSNLEQFGSRQGIGDPDSLPEEARKEFEQIEESLEKWQRQNDKEIVTPIK